MTQAERMLLKSRIQSLQSRKKRVGPFRSAGIQRTIDGMKAQLRADVWMPPRAQTAIL